MDNNLLVISTASILLNIGLCVYILLLHRKVEQAYDTVQNMGNALEALSLDEATIKNINGKIVIQLKD